MVIFKLFVGDIQTVVSLLVLAVSFVEQWVHNFPRPVKSVPNKGGMYSLSGNPHIVSTPPRKMKDWEENYLFVKVDAHSISDDLT